MPAASIFPRMPILPPLTTSGAGTAEEDQGGRVFSGYPSPKSLFLPSINLPLRPRRCSIAEMPLHFRDYILDINRPLKSPIETSSWK